MVILAVAPHVVVGEFQRGRAFAGFHGAQDYPIPRAALTLSMKNQSEGIRGEQ
jgi:hypothetical protein